MSVGKLWEGLVLGQDQGCGLKCSNSRLGSYLFQALATACWSVLKAKRRLLMVSD